MRANYTFRARRKRRTPPSRPRPPSSIAHVAGSGTACTTWKPLISVAARDVMTVASSWLHLDSGDRVKRQSQRRSSPTCSLHPGRRCVETSGDVIGFPLNRFLTNVELFLKRNRECAPLPPVSSWRPLLHASRPGCCVACFNVAGCIVSFFTETL